jgi:hypothetical protein
VNAELKAKLLDSGLVNFKLNADLFSVQNEDKLEISVQHQNLSELDVFFDIEDGITLNGQINEIGAKVSLHQGMLKGDLWADYKDLAIEMSPTRQTSAFKAALTNLIQKIEIAKTKPEGSKPMPHAEVNYQRRPGQGVVNFILQGLKEAAFKIASS